jgi:hypothetical protein
MVTVSPPDELPEDELSEAVLVVAAVDVEDVSVWDVLAYMFREVSMAAMATSLVTPPIGRYF